MSECGMPLIILMAIDMELKSRPEVMKQFEGRKPSLQEIIDALFPPSREIK